jgi:hypothetical protein
MTSEKRDRNAPLERRWQYRKLGYLKVDEDFAFLKLRGRSKLEVVNSPPLTYCVVNGPSVLAIDLAL